MSALVEAMQPIPSRLGIGVDHFGDDVCSMQNVEPVGAAGARGKLVDRDLPVHARIYGHLETRAAARQARLPESDGRRRPWVSCERSQLEPLQASCHCTCRDGRLADLSLVGDRGGSSTLRRESNPPLHRGHSLKTRDHDLTSWSITSRAFVPPCIHWMSPNGLRLSDQSPADTQTCQASRNPSRLMSTVHITNKL